MLLGDTEREQLAGFLVAQALQATTGKMPVEALLQQPTGRLALALGIGAAADVQVRVARVRLDQQKAVCAAVPSAV